jgi:hypothetical protein
MDRLFRRNARHPFALPDLVDICGSVSAIEEISLITVAGEIRFYFQTQETRT